MSDNHKTNRENAQKKYVIRINHSAKKTLSNYEVLIKMFGMFIQIPKTALHIINDTSIQAAIQRMKKVVIYKNMQTGETLECRAILESGNGKLKRLRLSQEGQTILCWIDPEMYNYYLKEQINHITGNVTTLERSFVQTETMFMMMYAGVQIIPYKNPVLSEERTKIFDTTTKYYYQLKALTTMGEWEKNLEKESKQKFTFTRCCGAIFSKNATYTVYNTRGSLKKISSVGETKQRNKIFEIASMNGAKTDNFTISQSIMFGNNYNTIAAAFDKNLDKSFSFESTSENMTYDTAKKKSLEKIYPNVYGVPLNEFGIMLLRMYMIPNWRNILLRVFNHNENDSGGYYDFIRRKDGVKCIMFLDSDVGRIIDMKKIILMHADECMLLCFPEQKEFLKNLFNDKIEISVIDTKILEKITGNNTTNLKNNMFIKKGEE